MFCTDDDSFGAAADAQRTPDLLTTDVSGFDPLLGTHLRGARPRGALDAQVPGHVAAAAAARPDAEPHVSPARFDSRTRRASRRNRCSTASTSASRGWRGSPGRIRRRRDARACRRSPTQSLMRRRRSASKGAAAAVPAACRGTPRGARSRSASVADRPSQPHRSGQDAAATSSSSGSNQKLDQFAEALLAADGDPARRARRRWHRDAGPERQPSRSTRRRMRPTRPCFSSVTLAGLRRRATRRAQGPLTAAKRSPARCTAKIPAARTTRRRTGRRGRTPRATTSSPTCRLARPFVRRPSASTYRARRCRRRAHHDRASGRVPLQRRDGRREADGSEGRPGIQRARLARHRGHSGRERRPRRGRPCHRHRTTKRARRAGRVALQAPGGWRSSRPARRSRSAAKTSRRR